MLTYAYAYMHTYMHIHIYIQIALGPACWLWDYLRRSNQARTRML